MALRARRRASLTITTRSRISAFSVMSTCSLLLKIPTTLTNCRAAALFKILLRCHILTRHRPPRPELSTRLMADRRHPHTRSRRSCHPRCRASLDLSPTPYHPMADLHTRNSIPHIHRRWHHPRLDFRLDFRSPPHLFRRRIHHSLRLCTRFPLQRRRHTRRCLTPFPLQHTCLRRRRRCSLSLHLRRRLGRAKCSLRYRMHHYLPCHNYRRQVPHRVDKISQCQLSRHHPLPCRCSLHLHHPTCPNHTHFLKGIRFRRPFHRCQSRPQDHRSTILILIRSSQRA